MSEVDWSQFDDWLMYGGAGGDWPIYFQIVELTGTQLDIITANVNLLMDSDAWCQKVQAFELALNSISSDVERQRVRSNYTIFFNEYSFFREAGDNLNFENYIFPCSVSFRDVNFGFGDVHFNGAKFRGSFVWFMNAVFEEGAISFNLSQFDSDICFSNAFFGNGNLYFEMVEISPNVSFVANDMVINGSLHVDCVLPVRTTFKGIKVSKVANFYGTTFRGCPDFIDASFKRPPEIAHLQVSPPFLTRENISSFFKTCPDGEAAPKYRKLKAMALAANDHDKDGEFFAYEMMAKRGHEITGFWELLANSFYYHVSYYGQSWIRPLIGVFISWFVFTFIYLNNVATILKAGSLNFSAIYSALNSFPFLSSLHRLTLKPQDYEGSLEKTLDTLAKHDGVVDSILNWAMFQQFIGIVLLFFLLLGLRNRFRLK